MGEARRRKDLGLEPRPNVYQGWMPLKAYTRQMPEEIQRKVAGCGGFWGAASSVFPQLASSKRVHWIDDDGQEIVCVAVNDSSDIPRALNAMNKRFWLAGFGWIVISAVGHPFEHSLIDHALAHSQHPDLPRIIAYANSVWNSGHPPHLVG